MPPPTNPKKRALMPSSPLRRALRAAGHHRSTVVQVGKEGVTPALAQQLSEALLAHELVKVKVGAETPEDRFETAGQLGAAVDAQVAQILGRTILVYRRHPEKPRFEPKPEGEGEPRAAARGKAKGAPRRAARAWKPKPRARARTRR
jgi:RNA-binding protein